MSYSGQLYFPCKQSQFTLVGGTAHSTASYTDTQFGVNISKATNGNNNEIATMLVSAPSTPYSVIAKVVWNGMNQNGTTMFGDPGPAESACGMCFTNGTATSSKLKVLRWGNLNGALTVNVNGGGTAPLNLFGFAAADQYSNYTTEVGNGSGEQHCPPTMGMGFVWMKLRDDGTNCKYYLSCDGMSWQQIYSEARTTYFTATNVGVYVNPYGSNANMVCQSFQVVNA